MKYFVYIAIVLLFGAFFQQFAAARNSESFQGSAGDLSVRPIERPRGRESTPRLEFADIVLKLQKNTDPLRRGHALLIGNSDYREWSKLREVPLQLAELRDGLKPHFETIDIAKDLTIEQLRFTITSFLRNYGNDSDARLFIYYAGHGYTETLLAPRYQTVGYITGVDTPPVDGSQKTHNAARTLAMSMMSIRAQLAESLAQHVLFVFDSCFAGTIFTSRQSANAPKEYTEDLVAELLEKPSRDFITTGSANETVPEHSPFPKLFLAALNGAADRYGRGVISSADINSYLRDRLLDLRGDIKLTPQYGRLPDPTFAEGEFLFRVAKANPETVKRREGVGGILVLPTLWPEAETFGISRKTHDDLMAKAAYDNRLTQKFLGDLAGTYEPESHVDELVVANLADRGKKLAGQHRSALNKIELQFGVPSAVLLAIWGRETEFGSYQSNGNGLAQLAVQALRGRREDAKLELLYAMRMLQEGYSNVTDMHSSSTGAAGMGLPSFLPTDFYKYAIDFDGDGKKDIWASVPDALASDCVTPR